LRTLIRIVVVVSIAACGEIALAGAPVEQRVIRDTYGAIIRGDVSRKQLALVFTGDEHGEGAADILEALKQRSVQAGFFITGNFVRQPQLRALMKRALEEGHYLGPHSYSHPLYCTWENRNKSLVTGEFFAADLRRNIDELHELGALQNGRHVFFIPPYEWYNGDQVRWSRRMGVTLINFTPGSGSNRDYALEGDPRFVPSQTIYREILAYEEKQPYGLNGFILLFHLGSGRQDPFHVLVGRLCDELNRRDYELVRIDQLLPKDGGN
jgi:peptidoglycan/xylan/chitin deacetylase (PgdA/CDA1 family)